MEVDWNAVLMCVLGLAGTIGYAFIAGCVLAVVTAILQEEK